MTKSKKVNKTEEIVIDFILNGLEKGELVWQKTWNGATGILPINHRTKTAYNGLNCYLSWVALEQGYVHNEWLTMNQVIAMKGLNKVGNGKFYSFEDEKGNKVKGVKLLKKRKDGNKQKACPVEYWRLNHREKDTGKYFTDKDYRKALQEGTHERADFMSWWSLANVYYVFNVEQTTLPMPKAKKAKKFKKTGAEKIVEQVYKGYINPPDFSSMDTEGACYIPRLDAVRVPKAGQFKSKHNGTGGNHYASTCFHEFIHSAGAEKRLNRVGITDFALFDKHKENYANEELIAEMGACMMMAYHNLDTSDTVENSQAYVKGWLSRLSNDRSLIPVAIRQSNSSVRHILGI